MTIVDVPYDRPWIRAEVGAGGVRAKIEGLFGGEVLR